MRLVSAAWPAYDPFDMLDCVKSLDSTSDATELTKDDILVVWGGGDIHPSLYNKGRSRHSGAYEMPSNRDRIEWSMMQQARALDIPIIGVCRGAQMLCALAGGFLIQHVNNHSGHHLVQTHDNRLITVNSIHHQMMFPFEVEHEMLAWSDEPQSDVYYDVDTKINVPCEPEFVYFPTVKGFAIQWHPEMMPVDSEASRFVLNFINDKVSEYETTTPV